MSGILRVKSPAYDCDVFFREDNSLLLLPTFFSLYLNSSGQGFSVYDHVCSDGVLRQRLEPMSLDETTIRIYTSKLNQFLSWLSEYDRNNGTNRLDTHNNLPSTFIRDYINEILIIEKKAGESSVTHHISALKYYFNYLAKAKLSSYKDIYYKPALRAVVKRNTKKRTAIKYLSKSLRLFLYENTSSLRDEILLRNGGELGLRTKESLGLMLDDFVFRGTTKPGLKSLWRQMKTNPKQMVFKYFLQGIYTKGSRGVGGKSRELYIPRKLLEKYLKYFQRERPPSNSNSLLVNNAKNAMGTPIKESKGSECFTEVKKLVKDKQLSGEASDIQMLESDHTYHCLRHSFATDKFEEYCLEDNVPVEEVAFDSSPFLKVARLMGHSINSQTTQRYIHLVMDKRHIVRGETG